MQYDLATDAGLRPLIAEHRTFDLAADHGRFHQDLVVVAQRGLQCLGETIGVLDLAHPHR
ncbi:hypothetical protein D3C73_1036820 [compost metagenome]